MATSVLLSPLKSHGEKLVGCRRCWKDGAVEGAVGVAGQHADLVAARPRPPSRRVGPEPVLKLPIAISKIAVKAENAGKVKNSIAIAQNNGDGAVAAGGTMSRWLSLLTSPMATETILAQRATWSGAKVPLPLPAM